MRLGSGIPSLLDATLHDAAPLLVVEWMRLWLTDLPPHSVRLLQATSPHTYRPGPAGHTQLRSSIHGSVP